MDESFEVGADRIRDRGESVVMKFISIFIAIVGLSISAVAGWDDTAFVTYTFFNGNRGYSVSVQKIGDMTYYRDSDGNTVTAMKIGDMVTFTASNGASATVQQCGDSIFINESTGNTTSIMKVGDQILVNGNNGYALSIQKIGDQIHVADDRGNSALVQRIGDQIHIGDNSGRFAVAQKIGDQTFISDNEGNSVTVRKFENSMDATGSKECKGSSSVGTRRSRNSGVSVARKKNIIRSKLESISYADNSIKLTNGKSLRFFDIDKANIHGWQRNDTIFVSKILKEGKTVGYKVTVVISKPLDRVVFAA